MLVAEVLTGDDKEPVVDTWVLVTVDEVPGTP